MAEQKYNIKSGFYDSINKDRLYSAEDMNRPYSRLINEGIFATKEGTPSTDFQVLSANDGMNIIVKKGEGMLAKKWIESPSDIVITVSNNTGIVPRKDSIIIQIDKRESGRIANVVYREGIASSNPIPPDLSVDDDIVEMRVANIYVAAGTAKIEQVAISDLRGSEECLWITSLVKQVDTSELFRQWQQAYEDLFQKIRDELENIKDGSAYLLKSGGTIEGALEVTQGINGDLTGDVTGNANTATKLDTARKINNTSFDGSTDITTALWGTARNIGIVNSDGTGTAVITSVNGSGNVNLKLPTTIKASITGNADTTTKLKTARTISLTGDITGSASFDGSKNISINTTHSKIKKVESTALRVSGTSATIKIAYPDGYGPTSCVVLTCGVLDSDNSSNPAYTYGDTDVNGNTLKCSINLTTNFIEAKITKNTSNVTYVDLKIILMKI